MGDPVPLRVVNATAPIRICDNGGWTDTWFAGHGKVFNIAVSPLVEVQIKVHPIGDLPGRVTLDAKNIGERYMFDPPILPNRHPLLEATIDEVGLPDELSLQISVFSEAPVGSSTGTSAAAAVALIGALDSLTPGRMTPRQVAAAAHRIEVDRLGAQSGIQDQLCAAFGGINYIEIASYPQASLSQLAVPNTVWRELDRRLVLLFLGSAHLSSEVHDRVIASLNRAGENAPQLEELRHAAQQARDAVLGADLHALGRAMIENTDAQSRLHPDLVSARAQAAVQVAAANGALGWKVNGAGGEGGSITLLCGPGTGSKPRLLRALRQADARFQIIPTHLSRHGLRVWPS
jgi:D-glycero-alpha-D-manno-heptose-7-phosphate kinase